MSLCQQQFGKVQLPATVSTSQRKLKFKEQFPLGGNMWLEPTR